MKNKVKFAIIVMMVCCFAAFWSCSDDDNVVEPSGEYGNAVVLRPISFPTLKGNICYELWLVNMTFTMDQDSNDIRIIQDEISLGKFYWDDYRYEFLDLKRKKPRDSIFHTPDGQNVYDYNVMAITLESLEDDGIRSNNGLVFDYIEYGQPIHGEFDFYRLPALEVIMPPPPPEEIIVDYTERAYSDDGDELSNRLTGIWFSKDSLTDFFGWRLLGNMVLPVFWSNANLTYEGWVDMPDFPRPISTGKFKNPYFRDWNNPYAGNYAFPNVPGEDFWVNPPSGFNFPLELIGEGEVFITVEPYPDPDEDEPFPLKLFSAPLPVDSLGPRDKPILNSVRMTFLYDMMPEFDAVVLKQ